MEKARVPSAENTSLRTVLIYPLGVLGLCFSAGNVTASFQLEPTTEIGISTVFPESQSNAVLSIRKGHSHPNRKVCCFNLQLLWVLTGAEGK